MNKNRKMKNRFAQTTAIALTAVMMTSNAIGTQASSTNLTNTDNKVATISVSGTTAGYTSVLAAASQPDEVTVTLNQQGDAIFSGMESAVNRVSEEKAAQEAAEAEAAAQAAAQAEAEAQAAAQAAAQAEAEAQAQTAQTQVQDTETVETQSYTEDYTETVQTTDYSATTNEAVSASADDLTLLAALIQCEAGGECYEGQVAVGAVVLNRLNSGYSSSIYGVIYQPGQFGPAQTGKLERVLAAGPSATCIAAASDALAGVDYTGGAHSFQVASTGISGTVIGNHVFF